MQLTIDQQLRKEPNRWIHKSLTIAFIFVIIAWAMGTINFTGIKENGFTIMSNIVSSLFQPDVDFLFDFKLGVPALLLQTIAIAFVGTIIGAILALPLAFLAARNIAPKWVNFIALTFIAAIRTFISKLYIEAIEDLDKRILESLDAAGCNTFEKIRYGILPQLFTDFASTVIYRFEINIKDASTLGLVGAGGIGALLIFAMNDFNWSKAGAILLGIIILVLIVETISTKLRTKLARG